jgi:putative transposase
MKTQQQTELEAKKKRKYSEKEKLAIVKESEIIGVKATIEKYADLFPATLYYWKSKVREMGDEGIKHSMTKDRLQEISRLKKENEQLKLLLAEKELESRLKDELVKKKLLQWKSKKG